MSVLMVAAIGAGLGMFSTWVTFGLVTTVSAGGMSAANAGSAVSPNATAAPGATRGLRRVSTLGLLPGHKAHINDKILTRTVSSRLASTVSIDLLTCPISLESERRL